jgi:hypothetical protein
VTQEGRAMMTEWRSPTAGAGRWAWQASLGLAVLLICVTGCAMYRVGTGSLYRPDIRTVHVPMVESDSFRRNIGEQLTEAIVKEIELKTPYKVVGSDRADSVLNARIVTDLKAAVETFTNSPISWSVAGNAPPRRSPTGTSSRGASGAV